MSESRTILVPIDFSECATEVVRRAAQEARRRDAELLLLHVIQTPLGLNDTTVVHPDGATGGVTVEDHLREEATTFMRRYLREALEAGVSARSRVEHGRPEDVIVQLATEVGAQRIIMGTHGRTGVSRLLLGSVANRVKKRASVPVETVRTVHRAQCEARSCAWCATHRSPAERDVLAELDG